MPVNPTREPPWKRRSDENGGKPNSGFPPFPTPLGNRTPRFPHFHRADDDFSLTETDEPARAWWHLPSRRTPKKGDIHRGMTASAEPTVSGSSRIGINMRFQAHPPLERKSRFRLISGLENAAGVMWLAVFRLTNVSNWN